MSVISKTMFNNQLNSFNSSHMRSRSYNELLALFKSSITGTGYPQNLYYVKKRSFSDLLKETSESESQSNKRSRTAPPSPPLESDHPLLPAKKLSKRARSLSPNKIFRNPLSPASPANKFTTTNTTAFTPSSEKATPKSSPTPSRAQSPSQVAQRANITLPSINAALNSVPIPSREPIKLKPITPTVSLDYFDTYKPNDENWRYEVLDTINRSSKQFNINQYNYLNKHASYKPNFDSKISSKIVNNTRPTLLPKIDHISERKINFPYESNYTYLNQTYMTDVQRYPEYLELAQSLILLSQPHQEASQYPPAGLGMPFAHNVHQHQHQHHNHGYLPNHAHIPTVPAPHTSYSATTSPSVSRFPTYQKVQTPNQSPNQTKFIPVTPPSAKSKSRSELLKSPTRSNQAAPRVCISCGSDLSPCWRPSWSIKEGQLCNSCGLRYKKTSTRCLNKSCKKIPAKGEWSLMQSKGKVHFDDGSEGYSCLDCGSAVEIKK